MTRVLFACMLALNAIIFSTPRSDSTITIGYATADFTMAKAAGFEFAEVRIREFMKLSDGDFDKFVTECHATDLPLTTGYWLFPACASRTGRFLESAGIRSAGRAWSVPRAGSAKARHDHRG